MDTPNNYINDAHRTSAPVEPVMDRLAHRPQSLVQLMLILTHIARWSAVLDKWKAWAYYGKGASYPIAIIEEGKTIDPLALEKALAVISDMHFLEIAHAIIGIGTEAGEMAEALLPALFEGKPLDTINLHEEAGDMTWYLAKLFKFTGTDFNRVMAANINKLKTRYPGKFTEEAAANRDLAAERAALTDDQRSSTDIEEQKYLS